MKVYNIRSRQIHTNSSNRSNNVVCWFVFKMLAGFLEILFASQLRLRAFDLDGWLLDTLGDISEHSVPGRNLEICFPPKCAPPPKQATSSYVSMDCTQTICMAGSMDSTVQCALRKGVLWGVVWVKTGTCGESHPQIQHKLSISSMETWHNRVVCEALKDLVDTQSHTYLGPVWFKQDWIWEVWNFPFQILDRILHDFWIVMWHRDIVDIPTQSVTSNKHTRSAKRCCQNFSNSKAHTLQ